MMNSSLLCLFVFTLGSLAAKFSKDVEESEAPGVNSLWKRSSGVLMTHRVASPIAKRETRGKRNTACWYKLNSSPVCFSAKNGQFGRFYIPFSGKLAAVKLIHRSGEVTCDTRKNSYWSYWGCGFYYSGDKIMVVITTAANHVLLPLDQFMVHHGAKYSKIPGYTPFSRELVLFFSHPYSVYPKQEFRLWYGEDLMSVGDGDNGGRACCDIYAIFI